MWVAPSVANHCQQFFVGCTSLSRVRFGSGCQL
jgi:hypothetical protein